MTKSKDAMRTNTTSITAEVTDETPRLALRPREAAKALGIGERLLWSLTNQGQIPHLRLGRAIVYPVSALEKWLVQRVQVSGASNEHGAASRVEP